MPQVSFKWPPVTHLVAVVCIVGFIALILYPVFQRTVDGGSHRFSCQSDLKQLGLAYIQYEQDADSALPPGINAAGNGWAGQLYPYAHSSYAYRCPDDPAKAPFISYAENRNLAGLSSGNLTAPAGTIALYEDTTLNCDPSKAETVSATGLSAPQDSTRHNAQTFALNFLLADGHVKMLTPGQVSGGISAVPPTHKAGYLATFAAK